MDDKSTVHSMHAAIEHSPKPARALLLTARPLARSPSFSASFSLRSLSAAASRLCCQSHRSCSSCTFSVTVSSAPLLQATVEIRKMKVCGLQENFEASRCCRTRPVKLCLHYFDMIFNLSEVGKPILGKRDNSQKICSDRPLVRSKSPIW